VHLYDYDRIMAKTTKGRLRSDLLSVKTRYVFWYENFQKRSCLL